MSLLRAPAGGTLHTELRAWPSYVLEEAARGIRRRVERALEDYGWAWDHVAILSVLRASHAGRLGQAALGDRTGMDRTTISEALSVLEEHGLVTRGRDPLDQRKVVVELTALGRVSADDGRQRVAAAEREALRPLTAREQERLHELLARLLPHKRHPLADLLG